MDANEISWLITFLTRTVARGEAETDILVHLVQKLSAALRASQSTPATRGSNERAFYGSAGHMENAARHL